MVCHPSPNARDLSGENINTSQVYLLTHFIINSSKQKIYLGETNVFVLLFHASIIFLAYQKLCLHYGGVSLVMLSSFSISSKCVNGSVPLKR